MSERTFEIGKPLFFAFLICAAAGVALWWWTGRLVTVENDEFSVGAPPDWDVETKDLLVTANGFLPQGSTAYLRVSYHHADGAIDWSLLQEGFPVEPEDPERIEIGGRRALLADYDTPGSRALGAVIDAGSGLIVFEMRCKPKYFDRNRSMFERSARSIRCKKP